MRVYFLGAGASKSIYPGPPTTSKPGLPTAKELTLDHLLNPSSYCNPGDGTDHIVPLRAFISAHALPPSFGQKPIEDVLGFFEDYPEEYCHLAICLLRRLWVPNTANISVLRDWLTEVRERGDVVLTTNYDTVVERGIGTFPGRTAPAGGGIAHTTLESSGLIDYGVPREMLAGNKIDAPTQQNSILLLKIHGSISWSYCESCKTARLNPTHRSEAESTLIGNGDCKNCLKSKMRSPIFVPPTKDKSYNQPVIRVVWKRAEEVLEKADEIIFAGFSLSTSDVKITQLLMRSHAIARTSRVLIVDRDTDGLTDRYRQVYGDAVQETGPTDWREYLEKETRRAKD